MSIHFLYLSSSAVGRQWFAVSSHFGGRTYRIETFTNCDSGTLLSCGNDIFLGWWPLHDAEWYIVPGIWFLKIRCLDAPPSTNTNHYQVTTTTPLPRVLLHFLGHLASYSLSTFQDKHPESPSEAATVRLKNSNNLRQAAHSTSSVSFGAC